MSGKVNVGEQVVHQMLTRLEEKHQETTVSSQPPHQLLSPQNAMFLTPPPTMNLTVKEQNNQVQMTEPAKTSKHSEQAEDTQVTEIVRRYPSRRIKSPAHYSDEWKNWCYKVVQLYNFPSLFCIFIECDSIKSWAVWSQQKKKSSLKCLCDLLFIWVGI